jgi:hypothetical protein
MLKSVIRPSIDATVNSAGHLQQLTLNSLKKRKILTRDFKTSD